MNMMRRIPVVVLCALCAGCLGVTTEYVQNSSALSMHVNQFMAENNRPPKSRRELLRYEKQQGLEPIASWFTSVRFSTNELGYLVVHKRKGWFLWEEGSGTTTMPMKRAANQASQAIGAPQPER